MVSGIPARITIREVAADTGLSIATVSRVLTGARTVTPEIADRVRESADRLGYRADSIGRSLRTQRTNTVGLVIPDITNPFFPSLIQAIEHAARAQGLAVLIADAENDAAIERAALETLLDRRVDAVIISPTDRVESLDALTNTARIVPTVQVDRVIDPTLPFARVNQSRPIAELVAHLRSAGRRRFVFIGQPTTMATSFERETAFTELMMADYPGEEARVQPGTISPASVHEAALQVLERWPDTDAIMCANDLIGVGVLQAIRSLDNTRGIAVTGFDDTLIAEAMGLTSVRQPVELLAAAALRSVFDPGPTTAQTELDATVVIRGSTA
jgi:LacI family transcriptional regulator